LRYILDFEREVGEFLGKDGGDVAITPANIYDEVAGWFDRGGVEVVNEQGVARVER
jgi:hypothetical protein